MSHRYAAIGGRALLILISLLVLNAALMAAETGTIITKDGRQFSDVSYKIDRYFKVVKFRFEGEKKDRAVSFIDVEAIINSLGRNIAPELLGDWYRPTLKEAPPAAEDSLPAVEPADSTIAEDAEEEALETETPEIQTPEVKAAPATTEPKTVWKSQESPVFKEKTKKYWNIGFRLGGNFSLPFGEYYTDVNSGVGFEGDFSVALGYMAALRFRVSRSGMTVDDDFFELGVPDEIIVSQTSSLTAIRYLLFLEYVHRINGPQNGAYFYAGVGAGATEHRMKTSAILTDYVFSYFGSADDSETKFTTAVDVGYIGMVSKSVGIDAGVEFDIIAVGRSEEQIYWGTYEVSYCYIFDLKLGIIFLF